MAYVFDLDLVTQIFSWFKVKHPLSEWSSIIQILYRNAAHFILFAYVHTKFTSFHWNDIIFNSIYSAFQCNRYKFCTQSESCFINPNIIVSLLFCYRYSKYMIVHEGNTRDKWFRTLNINLSLKIKYMMCLLHIVLFYLLFYFNLFFSIEIHASLHDGSSEIVYSDLRTDIQIHRSGFWYGYRGTTSNSSTQISKDIGSKVGNVSDIINIISTVWKT